MIFFKSARQFEKKEKKLTKFDIHLQSFNVCF